MEDDVDRRMEPANEGAAVKGFLVLSRLPFLSPGVAALVTGIVIALSEGYDPSEGLVWMSILGLVLIMLATYYFNEYFDYEGDIINKTFIKFSGGSRALPDNMVSRPVARIAGYSTIAALFVIAIIYMLFCFEDYPLLLPLALFGASCGVFYSHPPFQWAYQGIGEIVIGGCYGILAFVSGFYLVSGVLNLNMLLVGLPASLTIFLVILANEFPDFEADKAVNKRNLIVRLGPQKGAVLYAGVMMSVYPAMLATIAVGTNPWIAVAGLPILALAIVATAMALKGGFVSPSTQTKISGLTLLANLLSSLMFIPVVLIW
jgi:1,4-dihydroxy-2-naphthoate octaprenyltransferase